MTEQKDYKNIKIGADTFWRANRLKLQLRESGQRCSYDDLINAGLKYFEQKSVGGDKSEDGASHANN